MPIKNQKMRYNLDFSFDDGKIPLSEVNAVAGKCLDEIRDLGLKYDLILESQRTYKPKPYVR